MTEVDDILAGFPLAKPRRSQVKVLHAIQEAFEKGYKNVLLEAPVGSGKSAIAITVAKYFGNAHVLTPRKSLQDQYLEDFGDHGISLMKGRGAYPCTFPSENRRAEYQDLVHCITNSLPIRISPREIGCDNGPCKNDQSKFRLCTGTYTNEATGSTGQEYVCPYSVAVNVAQQSDLVIHNLHSFIFQGYFASRFETREIMIVDECHEMENTIRGFAEIKFHLPGRIDPSTIPTREAAPLLSDWTSWFEQFTENFSDRVGRDGVSERMAHLDNIRKLDLLSDQFAEKFVVETLAEPQGRFTTFRFIPELVGNLTNKFLLNFGKKRLLMSGTIYNKTLFCKNNGLVDSETCFIQIPSSFPVSTRPIYAKPEYLIDTSHKGWDTNFVGIISRINVLLEIFSDVKGLIHTPSYHASRTLFNALKDTNRIITHEKDNFQEVLRDFFEDESGTDVLLSPICQQGVDFKYARARFQIILRVPYLNTSDPFVEHKVKNDFPWYNYQAMVIFGQQTGRINRAEDDFGATILMDERFTKFLSKNSGTLPKWLKDAIIYR